MTLMTRTATSAALAALLSAPAFAEDSFGGSFDDGFEQPAAEASSDSKEPEPNYGTDTQAQAGSQPAADDGFGGSFGPGSETTTDSGTTGTTAETADSTAQDGDFDPDFSITGTGTGTEETTETAMPETQPEPQPEPQPEAQPETNQQAQAITVDPQILTFESRDYGVPPTGNLRNGGMHAPTPTMVPGASVVSTEGLANAMASGLDMIIIDVLGQQYSLPSAYMIPEMSSPGSYQDRIQQQTGQFLAQVTGQVADYPIILYCSDPQCWLSYNATLRVVAAGYTNVYWYRGGITAWQMAGFPVYPSGY
ncbi:rhodanese-like domain-containing protein [Roseovarius indicus]|uniref:rhodanese-like domain-containing protein n=1 Tax=Roseovarius indicus TaxID=540747 RepID=UPI0032EF037F